MQISRFILSAVLILMIREGVSGATAPELLQQAGSLAQRGDRTRALDFVNQAIEADNKMADAFFLRGKLYSSAGEPKRAVPDFNRALELAPDKSEIYQWRGGEQFRLGQIDASIADFDKFLAAYPERDPHHWQRGISYYYARRFEEGRRQFERHQTVNSHDVENAVWHFLCVAQGSGLEEARANLIPIQGDSRVPMAQVHQLFAGKGTVEAVLEAAQAGELPAAEKHQRMFYAYLYLSLYYDALGDLEKARQHILAATGKYAVENYMGDVARIHARKLAQPKQKQP